MKQKDLIFLRKKIDDIDVKIVELLNQRCDMVEAIAVYKKYYNLPIENKTREDEILKNLSDKERYINLVNTIYPSIFNFSKYLENK